ncbi:MAG: L-threonine 3-dehydrogenase [Clostridiaceae bacterium]|nr:L-threonine 3-dehydrogenase [Clostridiaceae bacterium]
MKALVKKYEKAGLWLDEVPIPETGPGDVLVRVLKTAICGTDLHIYNWDSWSQKTIPAPMVTGHEFVGVVEAIGENVKKTELGALVTAEGHIVCDKCRNCKAGRKHLCMDTKGIGVQKPGSFAEYISVPEDNIWSCPDNLNKEIISCFDPLGNAVHTALSFDLFGEDVLITGAGPIGIMATGVAKHAGARHIVVTDVNPYRLDLARKMGASVALNVREGKITDVMAKLNMKEGFDVGLEMSGNGSALNSMIDNMCHGGKIALLGIHAPDTCIDWNKVVFSGITIKGIYGRQMYDTWYKMTSMIQSGLDISPVITHRFHYTEYEKGFELMKSGNCGKVILEWD